MSVHTEFDHGSLVWVKGELEQTLSRAATALGQYQNAPDAALLKHAQTHLHQAVGALHMVELAGLARYCEEIEQLVASVAREQTPPQALEHAVGAIGDTTRYLERISAGAPNVPLALRAPFAELAALHGAQGSGAELFYPQLGALEVPANLPHTQIDAAAWPAWVRQQRTRFESGLLRWLRNKDASGATAMARSLSELAAAQHTAVTRSFWWSAAAVVDALPTNRAGIDLDARVLLMRMNLQLRRLSDGSAKVAERLFRDLLYILAHQDSQSALAQHLRTAFELPGMLTDAAADTLSPEAQARLQSARALRDELNTTKELWSRVAAGQAERLPALAAEVEQLAQRSVPLEIPGLTELWTGVKAALERYRKGGIGEAEALELATALLLADNALAIFPQTAPEFTEQALAMVQRLQDPHADVALPQLDAVSREAQEKLLVAQLAQEMRSNLQVIEEALDGFFRDSTQRAALQVIDPSVRQVQGALLMLGCDDAVLLLQACQERVLLLGTREDVPTQAELEELAEGFSTIGFYIDALEQGRDENKTLVQPMLTRLTGFVPPQPEVTDVAEVLEAEPPMPNSMVQEVEPAHVEAVASEPARAIPQSDEAIDAELLEVYLEEAVEVLATIAAQVEICKTAPHDREALTVLRRAFHTLKGSGRMVGLNHLGEAAWAVEQVMNKWLQVEQPATQNLLNLVNGSHDAFQRWVEQLHATGTATVDSEDLIKSAHALIHALDHAPAGGLPSVEVGSVEAIPFAAEEDEEAADIHVGNVVVSATLFSIFKDEAERHLHSLQNGRAALAQGNRLPPDFLLAAHTLGGIASTAGFRGLGELSYALEHAIQQLGDHSREHAPQLSAAVDRAEEQLGQIFAQQAPGYAAAEIAALAALHEEALELSLEDSPAAHAAPAISLAEVSPADFASAESAIEFAAVATPEASLELSEAATAHAVAEDEFTFSLPVDLEDPAEHEDPELAALIDQELAGETEAHAPAAAHEQINFGLSAEETAHALETEPVEFTSVLDTEEAVNFSFESAPLATPFEDTGSEALTLDLDGELHADLTGHLDTPLDAHHATLDAAPFLPADPFELDLDTPVTADALHLNEPVLDTSFEASTAAEPLAFTPADEEISLSLDELDALVPDAHNAELPVPGFELALGDDALDLTLDETTAALAEEAQLEALPGTDHDHAAAATHAVEAADGLPEHEPAHAADHTSPIDPFAAEEPLESWLNEIAPFEPQEHAATPHHNEHHTAPVETDLTEADAEEIAYAPAAELGLSEPVFAPQHAVAYVPPVAEARADTPIDNLLTQTSGTLSERKADLDNALIDEIDEQLLPVFVEEGDELLPQIGAVLRALQEGDNSDADKLKRVLHTLKGSARMSGAMRMGEAVHLMESRLLAAGTHFSRPLLEELESDYDLTSLLFDELSGRKAKPADVVGGIAVQAAAPRAQSLVAAPDSEGKTTIRVKSELVDELVNQAGEVSISRARIESEMLALKASLLDLTENVTRLRGQMRELEIQAESQMQAREKEVHSSEEASFDPLEFDRFTRLQEITRFIAESVNDVSTIQHNLLKNLDESSAALTSQARMTKELQQSLMRVRMVPFSSISDRLYRLTRTTGKETGKKVNLELRGSRVEIDRGVLEKMISPFEHMLRNAIDHGLETPSERETTGKSEFGEVLVEVRQEGNELVLLLKDDGKGLNLERIRAKALEKGLIEAGQDIADRDLMQMIFEPGFSTASSVTQLSGRGIGMDVVKNEIGNLGGRVDVSSEAGQGTTFTINLPLTLAVTQVLLVKAAGRLYAIPSVMIEQVQELKQEPLARLYDQRAQDWLGSRYPFSYFPRILGDATSMPETKRFSTVLLLRSGANRMALHVDELVKNQEVVVKAIGPQLARIPGVAGSTVLGNGDIVLIMNPLALLARGEVATQTGQTAPTRAEQLKTVPVVMVVDDSLTVRKITGRLLAREGFQVQTAKDGIDALQQLQDLKPAVMLVDIEMPRMDGFELTRHIRANEDTRDIPIIMITSRTADKHRNYANELGVNVFLGKPYQEDELLAHIRQYVRV